MIPRVSLTANGTNLNFSVSSAAIHTPLAPRMFPVPVAFRAAVGALRVVLAVAAGEVMVELVGFAALGFRAAGTGVIRVASRRAGRRDDAARREICCSGERVIVMDKIRAV